MTEMKGWRSIDSAPRDGTPILLGCPEDDAEERDAKSTLGWWEDAFEDGADYMGHDGGFVDYARINFLPGRSIGNPRSHYTARQPTHWQPLPVPPSPDPVPPGATPSSLREGERPTDANVRTVMEWAERGREIYESRDPTFRHWSQVVALCREVAREAVIEECARAADEYERSCRVEEGRADSSFERRHYESLQQAAIGIAQRIRSLSTRSGEGDGGQATRPGERR